MSDAIVPEYPLLQPWRDYAVTPDRVILRYAEGAVVFEGRASITLLPELLSRLDGSRTLADLVEELGAPTEPAVRQAVELLAERGLLLEGPAGSDAPEYRTARALAEVAVGDMSVEEIASRVVTARAVVVGDGSLARAIAGAMHDSGVGTVGSLSEKGCVEALEDAVGDDEDAIVVIAPATPYARALTDVNRWALSRERDWMQVLPYDGHRAVVGPLFAPPQTGCYHCFRLRRRAAVDFHAEAADVDAAADAQAVHRSAEWRAHPQDMAIAGQAAYFALWQTLPQDKTLLPILGRAVTMGWSMVGPTIEDHTLLRVPRCRECGRSRQTGVPQPWLAGSAKPAQSIDDVPPHEHGEAEHGDAQRGLVAHTGPGASERQAALQDQGTGAGS